MTATTMQQITVDRLTPTIGAEIRGVDLGDLDDATLFVHQAAGQRHRRAA